MLARLLILQLVESTSFLLVLAFYMAYFAGQDLGGRGVVHHAVGGWGPTAVSALVGAFLFARLRT